MKLRSLKSLFLALFGTACFLGLNFSLCGPTNPTTHNILNDLIITNNQITGWVIDSAHCPTCDSVQHFTDATAWIFVDGGNMDYCGSCNGTGPLKGGLGTYFLNPATGYKLSSFVLDYGTASGAKTELNTWVNKRIGMGSNQVTISPYPTTTALGFETGGGLYAYAIFSNFFIELDLQNYAQTSDAVADAQVFLNYYHSKIQ